MADWRYTLSFAVFYNAVYLGNTNNHQYENVSILLDGVRLNTVDGTPSDTKGQDMASKYCRGSKPISKIKASAFKSLPEEVVIERVRESSLSDAGLAAATLKHLIASGHIAMSAAARRDLLAFPYQPDPYPFLARALMTAIDCPKEQVVRLSDESIQDIADVKSAIINAALSISNSEVTAASYITEPASMETASVKPESVLEGASEASTPTHAEKASEAQVNTYSLLVANYSVCALDYAKDRLQYKLDLLKIQTPESDLAFTEDDVLASTDIFRRAKATFLIQFEGSLPALMDLFLHRVSSKQCMQIVFICEVKSKREINIMRNYLKAVIDFALAEDGRMFFTCGYEPKMPDNMYRAQIIYSINSVSDDERLRLQLAVNPPAIHLMPAKQYRGRVPDFLLPHSANTNQSIYPEDD